MKTQITLTGRCWLRDSAGAWLDCLTDATGRPIAGDDLAHMPLPHPAAIALGAMVRVVGQIERGETMLFIHADRWTLIEEHTQ